MKLKTKALIFVILICSVEVVIIKPVIPAFFGMTLLWKILYVISLFGFPLLIVIPLSFITAPLAYLFKNKLNFKTKWFNYTQNIFLVFGILILILNSILVVSKFGMGNDPFPLIKYSEIEGFEGNLDDLKIEEYENKFGVIKRYKDKQIETYNNGEVAEFKIVWISNNEYRLINQNACPYRSQ